MKQSTPETRPIRSFSDAHPFLAAGLRSAGNALITILIIIYISQFGLILAERGREQLPAQPLMAAGEAVIRTGEYLFQHPETYYFAKQDIPAGTYVLDVLGKSSGLLLASMGIALLLGIVLGTTAALARTKFGAALVVLISVLGTSTPSFLLAMLFWVLNLAICGGLKIHPLPPTGYGWDLHLIMPALALSVRPMAQIAQVTYINLSDILGQDYIRTAKSKGLSDRLVRVRHALPNMLIPILATATGTLRYALASLPIIETFFLWPGIGLTILKAIQLGYSTLVTDLTVSLGMFFLVVNLIMDVLYPILDPRMRKQKQDDPTEPFRWRDLWESLVALVSPTVEAIYTLITGKKAERKISPLLKKLENQHGKSEQQRISKRWIARLIFENPAFLVGCLLAIGLIVVAFGGESWSVNNPYEFHNLENINGKITSPPFKPGEQFPWGSDYIGRDIQALILSGGKRTLGMAFLGMAARLVLGTLLGIAAGWWHDSRFDRVVLRLTEVWAAFPVTIFAMLLIQAIGIQQGMSVFLVTICVVGWGEVAQYVRAQTMRIKPQLYIEAAQSMGARPGALLLRQVFPNLVPSLIVLAAMEMGAVLMLLAELGFLNIFMGGGFAVELTDMGRSVALAHFSDVPEWSALLANIHLWWRSYPWMAWYPGTAFFLAIITFNLLAEGLRRFIEESRVNLSRIFNRYTFAGVVAAAIIVGILVQSATPLGVYSHYARTFDAQAVMQDIQALTAQEMQGRESAAEGSYLAADYIAREMEEIGLFAPNPDGSYLQTNLRPRAHLTDTPMLDVLDEQENSIHSFIYRQDFAETGGALSDGEAQGRLLGVVMGADPNDATIDKKALTEIGISGKIIIVRERDMDRMIPGLADGILIVDDSGDKMDKKFLPLLLSFSSSNPGMYISQKTASDLLATMGTTLEGMEDLRRGLKTGEAAATAEGALIRMKVNVVDSIEDHYDSVIGVLPGIGASVSGLNGQNLDATAIVVSAYYDGLGIGPDGTIYSGANDNASGVATMLELARKMKNSAYEPKKTIIFVAWTGGDRGEQLSLAELINGSTYLLPFDVEGVIELSGVGAGTGKSIAVGGSSGYKLVNLVQDASSRMGVTVTTRGRGPHYDVPVYETPVTNRKVPTLYLSWDGADVLAHTPQDTIEQIDIRKLEKIGKVTLAVLLVMSRELVY